MTQKEKLLRYYMGVSRIEAIAKDIEKEAKNYDEKWPLEYSKKIIGICNILLSVDRKKAELLLKK